MNILIACDKFRGALTSAEANQAIATAAQQIFPEASVETKQMADGGEGTVSAFVDAWQGCIETSMVENAFGQNINVEWGWIASTKTAIIEISAVAGHANLLGQSLDPTKASSFGLGQLICCALAHGAKTIIIGLGGSITIDAGAGVLEALGACFLAANNKRISHPSGMELNNIATIDFSELDKRLRDTNFVVASDIDSPLTGPTGAVEMFGPQKGLQPSQFRPFETGLIHFDQLLAKYLNYEPRTEHPGAGAAGGIYIGLSALGGVTIHNGFNLMADAYDLETHVKTADFILSGEGAFDEQSLVGKGTGQLAQLAAKHQKPIIMFTGNVNIKYETLKAKGVVASFPIAPKPVSLDEALTKARDFLGQSACNVLSALKAGTQLSHHIKK